MHSSNLTLWPLGDSSIALNQNNTLRHEMWQLYLILLLKATKMFETVRATQVPKAACGHYL